MECRTCKHWQSEKLQDWTAEGIGFGLCHRVQERWEIQDAAIKANPGAPVDEDYDLYDPDENNRIPKPGTYDAIQRDALIAARAYTQDGSDYRADLLTAPDFFCALYEGGDWVPEGYVQVKDGGVAR